MSIRRCSHCRSTSVHRSRRRGVFEILVLRPFRLRPYRCWTCFRRHYGFVSAKPYTGLVDQESFFPRQPSEALQAAPLLLVLLFAVPFLLASSGPVLQKLGLAGRDPISAASRVSSPDSASLNRRLTASRETAPPPLQPLEGAVEPSGVTIGEPAKSSSVGMAAPAQKRQPIGPLRTSGEVYLNEAQLPQEAVVFPKDVLRTGAGSAAVLQVPGTGTIVVSERTRISFGDFGEYFAILEYGAVSFSSSGAARNVKVRIGRFVIIPDPESADCAAEIELAPDGSGRVRATRGSVGVIDLEGPQTVFISAGQGVSISPEGRLQSLAAPAQPTVAATPQAPSLPPPAEEKTKSRAGWVALGVGGGGAAAAAALLARRHEAEAASPSAP